jgi:two-component system cell cycle sensor histidine kinase/response regulator CckA
MSTERLIDRLVRGQDPLARLLFAADTAGLMVLDRAGRVLAANEALRAILAPAPLPAPGTDGLAIVAPAEREQVRREWQVALEGGPRARLNVRLAVPKAEEQEAERADPERIAAILPTAIIEEDGSASGLLVRVADMTERRRLNNQLAQARRLQAIGELAGGIAHDINNLLTTISVAAGALAERTARTPGGAGGEGEEAADILAAAARGAALVRQLLAFARRQTLQPRRVALDEAIAELATLLRRVLGDRIRVVLDLRAAGVAVLVDPTQLDQVLMNLAINARDAMADGGTLTLHSGHVTLYRPLTRGLEHVPAGRYAMIEVRDTGCGIAPDHLPRIFEPFFTTRREAGGSGLGLATVHGIVHQSGGFVSVDSTLGEGSRFRIYLPIAAGEAPPPAPPGAEAAAGASAAAGTVLLVEDEDPLRRVTARGLERRGWTVAAYDSAESALAALESGAARAPDILVSDVLMPGMDGPSLVRAARRLHPGLPALLVSGYADEKLRDLQGSENIHFLSKPYDAAKLDAAIRGVRRPQAVKE